MGTHIAQLGAWAWQVWLACVSVSVHCGDQNSNFGQRNAQWPFLSTQGRLTQRFCHHFPQAHILVTWLFNVSPFLALRTCHILNHTTLCKTGPPRQVSYYASKGTCNKLVISKINFVFCCLSLRNDIVLHKACCIQTVSMVNLVISFYNHNANFQY